MSVTELFSKMHIYCFYDYCLTSTKILFLVKKKLLSTKRNIKDQCYNKHFSPWTNTNRFNKHILLSIKMEIILKLYQNVVSSVSHWKVNNDVELNTKVLFCASLSKKDYTRSAFLYKTIPSRYYSMRLSH